MQDELNCDVARFTTYESNLSCNKPGSQVACVQIPSPLPSEKIGKSDVYESPWLTVFRYTVA